MRAILKALRREGYDLNDKWQYHGSDPSKVRSELKGMGSEPEIKVAAEAVSIVLAVNFYGTMPVKDGSFRTAKKAKFAKEASDLLSKVPSRFSNLEKQMKTKVTLNALDSCTTRVVLGLSKPYGFSGPSRTAPTWDQAVSEG